MAEYNYSKENRKQNKDIHIKEVIHKWVLPNADLLI